MKKKETKKSTYVIARSCSAGVFAGYLKSRKGREVILTKARRIWYWKGAASLSELAMKGTACPKECNFPMPVDQVTLLDVTEILDVTQEAQSSIESVPVWTSQR